MVEAERWRPFGALSELQTSCAGGRVWWEGCQRLLLHPPVERRQALLVLNWTSDRGRCVLEPLQLFQARELTRPSGRTCGALTKDFCSRLPHPSRHTPAQTELIVPALFVFV